MSGNNLGIGIIGVGGMGGRHARNLATAVAGTHVAAVMDTDRARAEDESQNQND